MSARDVGAIRALALVGELEHHVALISRQQRLEAPIAGSGATD
jgi:hypothetical protein